MFIPAANLENDLATIFSFVRGNSLCALVTETDAGVVASHIPVVLHEELGTHGVLRGHLARANPQWKNFHPSRPALAIFSGPQHYISASWYPEKMTDGREVPTWNYVAVHAYGSLRFIHDPGWLLEHLRALTDENEVITKIPWQVDDAPPEFIAGLSKGIVGFELDIARFESKWKASQNRNDTDAAGVVTGLENLATPAAMVMSWIVTARRP